MASIVLPKSEQKPTLTLEETATCLGLGRSTAYRYAALGLIPSIKVGNRRIVSTAALRAFLKMPL